MKRDVYGRTEGVCINNERDLVYIYALSICVHERDIYGRAEGVFIYTEREYVYIMRERCVCERKG